MNVADWPFSALWTKNISDEKQMRLKYKNILQNNFVELSDNNDGVNKKHNKKNLKLDKKIRIGFPVEQNRQEHNKTKTPSLRNFGNHSALLRCWYVVLKYRTGCPSSAITIAPSAEGLFSGAWYNPINIRLAATSPITILLKSNVGFENSVTAPTSTSKYFYFTKPRTTWRLWPGIICP